MLNQNVIDEINHIGERTGKCHYGIAADNLIGVACENVGDNDTYATDLSLVTCHDCKYLASKVLRWAMRNPQRVPQYARKDGYKVGF